MVNVQYVNGQKKKVPSSELEALIESRKIIAFKRQDGWAEIDKARLRKRSDSINKSGRIDTLDHSSNKFLLDTLAQKVIELAEENRSYKEVCMDLQKIIHGSSDAITQQSIDGTIVFWSKGAERMYGYSKEEALGMNIVEIVPVEVHDELYNFMNRLKLGEDVESFETKRQTKDSKVLDIWLKVSSIAGSTGKGKITTIERDITERNKKARETQRLVEELQKALGEIKKLKGFIPICSSCKNVRDDNGYWIQIETYLKDHAPVEFSHSICPECAKMLYPDVELYSKAQTKS